MRCIHAICSRWFPVLLAALCLLTPAIAQESPKPLRIVMAHGPGKGPLAEFAKYLEGNYHVRCSWVVAEKSRNGAVTKFTGLESLDVCDVILSNLYRTWAPPEQLSVLKQHFRTKPVVGLRKAHHGFQNWLEADQEVFGATYKGHYGIKRGVIRVAEGKQNHALVEGHEPFLPGGGLYRHIDLAKDTDVLLIGGPEGKELVPQMWTRVNARRGGQRVIYTRYDPKDLADPGVREMVLRCLFWAAAHELNVYRRPLAD